MEKTAKALKTVIENAKVGNAKVGNAVGVISLEMPVLQLTSRMVSIDTNFHLGQLMKTGFDKPESFKHLFRIQEEWLSIKS